MPWVASSTAGECVSVLFLLLDLVLSSLTWPPYSNRAVIGQAQSSNRALIPIAQSGMFRFPSNRFLSIGPIVSFAPIVQSSHQPVPMTVSPLAVTPFLPLLRNRSIGPGQAIGSIGQNAQSPNRAQDPIGPIGQLANRAIGQVPQSCNCERQPIAQSRTCSNLPIRHPGTFEANRSNGAQSVLQRCSNLAARPSHNIFGMQI